MNPDMNVPPATDPALQPQPGMPLPGQPMQPMQEQPMGQPYGPQPAQPPLPQPPMGMPQSETGMPGAGMSPAEMPAPAPQPMFSPMTGPMPGQPTPGQPMGQPYGPQPVFTPMAASQMSKSGGKKKFIIIGAILAVLILGGGGLYLVASRTTLVGPLGPDSFKGLNYKRPTSWIKDTSVSDVASYHPKQSLGRGADGEETYALKMAVHAQDDVFDSAPNAMDADYKTALQQAIDEGVSSASKDILPSKSEAGCDDDPVYKDKPKKIDTSNAFLAITYSFTCNVNNGSSKQTDYYTVVDLVPNDKNTEYVVELGAASDSVYKTNLSKITEILNSISF